MDSEKDGRVTPGGCLDILDGLDTLFYAGMAVLLLVGGWYVSFRILLSSFGFFGPAALIVWTVTAIVLVLRDVIRRKWSPVSVGATLLFLLSLCVVIALEFRPPAS